MKKLIRKILFGDIEITEYSTITCNGEIRECAYLKTNDKIINVSAVHWVFCLEPVVFGVWIENKNNAAAISSGDSLELQFYNSLNKDISATALLQHVDKIEDEKGILFLLKLVSCKLYHTNSFKLSILFNRYYKKPGLIFEYYKSLITAYSFPRRVRLVSFKEEDYFNIFPMDLLGEISSSKKYVFGLRHTNITLAKIIEAGKVVVSEISSDHKKIIYQLGKHHSSNPPSLSSLSFKTIPSVQFGFPVAIWTERYKEIRIIKTIDLGSHMLMWGEVINEEVLNPSTSHLFHIHFLQYFHQHAKGFVHELV